MRDLSGGLLDNFGSTFNNLETYGCNCHAVIYGGKPSGKPVDKLDSICQQYLSCTKCIKNRFEGYCDEDVSYQLGFTNFQTSFYR
jgi:hypothetical protein